MTDGQNAGRLILVSGATGNQGGAAARALLGRGFRVRALTRDPRKPAARVLADLSAEVVRGDLEDRSSLDRALEGARGVFSVQNVMEAGVEGEIRQGKALVDAAVTAGVAHFVYSSVGSANRGTGLPFFDTKGEIEARLRASGLPYTILRPVFFMQNWDGMRDQILAGTLAQPLDPDKPVQQVNVEDIGALAAMAFEDPEHWIGREVDVAGDELTMPQVAETIGRVTGRDIGYHQVPWDQFRRAMGEDFTVMNRWFNDVGWEADISALRREYPELSTLERYLLDHGWVGGGFCCSRVCSTVLSR